MIEAKDIREIHRLFDQWEARPLASEARPAWAKKFKLSYGFGALIFGLCLSLVETKTMIPRGALGYSVIGIFALIAISMVYGLTVLVVEGIYLIKSTHEERRGFSKDDDSDLEQLLQLMYALAKFPPETLEFVAASLETRSKSITEWRTFLKWIATLVGAVIAFPLSHSFGSIARQLVPFPKHTFLIGYGLAGLAITVGGVALIYLIESFWSKSLACSARALRLRQVLSQREALLEAFPDSPEAPSSP